MKRRRSAMLKTIFCAAGLVLLAAFSPAQAAQLDAAAVEKLKADAEAGNAAAQEALGECHASFRLCAGVPRNDAKAREWFEKAASRGDADALYNLGVMHAKGRSVRQDYAAARALWERAAAQGHARAQANLGVMHKNGHGVEKDRAAAREWFGKACDNGFQPACEQWRRLGGER